MSIKCAGCGADVPDVVSTASFKTRLDNQADKIRELSAQLDGVNKSLKIAEQKAVQYDSVAAELAQVKRSAEIDAAITAAGLDGSKSPERLRKLIGVDYDEHTAAEGEKAKPLGEWLAEIAKTDVAYLGWQKPQDAPKGEPAKADPPKAQPPKVEPARPPVNPVPVKPDEKGPEPTSLRAFLNSGAPLPADMANAIVAKAPPIRRTST